MREELQQLAKRDLRLACDAGHHLIRLVGGHVEQPLVGEEGGAAGRLLIAGELEDRVGARAAREPGEPGALEDRQQAVECGDLRAGELVTVEGEAVPGALELAERRGLEREGALGVRLDEEAIGQERPRRAWRLKQVEREEDGRPSQRPRLDRQSDERRADRQHEGQLRASARSFAQAGLFAIRSAHQPSPREDPLEPVPHRGRLLAIERELAGVGGPLLALAPRSHQRRRFLVPSERVGVFVESRQLVDDLAQRGEIVGGQGRAVERLDDRFEQRDAVLDALDGALEPRPQVRADAGGFRSRERGVHAAVNSTDRFAG
ncbi:MAG: hypothetical protein ACOZQL_01395 [Myxococcota bacterium]